MKIFVMGFMASGKSRNGRLLAQLLNYQFIDLDDFLVKSYGKTIPEIFETEGETRFRELESKYLKSLENQTKTVISLGGGTPCFNDNISWINQKGVSIYIKCKPEILLERLIKGAHKRPLVRGKSKEELFKYIIDKTKERSVFYEQAHILFEVENGEEDVAKELSDYLLRRTGKK